MAVRVDPREDYRETILAGQESVLVVPARPAAPARRSRQGQDTTLAYTILTPTFAVILGMVAYPFFIGIWLSLQSKMVGAPGRFVGLQNYVELFRSDLFIRTMSEESAPVGVRLQSHGCKKSLTKIYGHN